MRHAPVTLTVINHEPLSLEDFTRLTVGAHDLRPDQVTIAVMCTVAYRATTPTANCVQYLIVSLGTT